MKSNKHLGASWESSSLHFVESSETTPEKVFHVPFEPRSQTLTAKNTLDLWESDLAKNIRDALKKHKVSTTIVNLSLPTNDIIFRSFVIPWMQQREIKSVVEFEIGKYIPFSLSELSHSHHAISIAENNIKQIRIIFVAIKNDALANYVRVFKAASLTTDVIEPSALSLIRALSFKKLIPEDQTIAVIQKGDVGKIIICNKNTPQFVREFFLSGINPELGNDDPESTAKKLTKEVRISLDYFNRQNESLNVEKIFFLSSTESNDLPENLSGYLDIPVSAINNSSVLDNPAQLGIGALNAYGASIVPFVSPLASFNLSKNKTETPKSISSKKISSRQLLVLTALICVPLFIGSIVLSVLWTQQVKKETMTLNKKLGSFQDADVSFIKEKEGTLKSKLTILQQTRIKSDAATFLLIIPNLLPEGTWIKSLDISYYDDIEGENPSSNKRRLIRVDKGAKPSLVISIDGYAYSDNRGEQFKLVNMLLGNLKNNEEFSSFFQNIALETIAAQKLKEYDVTYFKILSEQTNENIRPQ